MIIMILNPFADDLEDITIRAGVVLRDRTLKNGSRRLYEELISSHYP